VYVLYKNSNKNDINVIAISCIGGALALHCIVLDVANLDNISFNDVGAWCCGYDI